MTTFGHSLTGLAALTLVIPSQSTWQQRLFWAFPFIALANVPDWPLPWWGHQRPAISHSLWLNLALCTTFAIMLWRGLAGHLKTRVLLSGAAVWLSHFFLDALYGDLPGVAIYWPFSDGLASLPLPWLGTLPHVPPPFDAAVIKVLFLELITFAPLILLAYGLRRLWMRRENLAGGSGRTC